MAEKKRFVNPYNFIPFEGNINDKRISRETAYAKKSELLSGWLVVELTTRTPLIIPDGAHPKYWDIEKMEYFNGGMRLSAEKMIYIKNMIFLEVQMESQLYPEAS